MALRLPHRLPVFAVTMGLVGKPFLIVGWPSGGCSTLCHPAIDSARRPARGGVGLPPCRALPGCGSALSGAPITPDHARAKDLLGDIRSATWSFEVTHHPNARGQCVGQGRRCLRSAFAPTLGRCGHDAVAPGLVLAPGDGQAGASLASPKGSSAFPWAWNRSVTTQRLLSMWGNARLQRQTKGHAMHGGTVHIEALPFPCSADRS